MSKLTKIQWTDRTWNPTRGCRRISPGCLFCYAEVQANLHRWKDKAHTVPGPFEGFVTITNGRPNWTGRVELLEHKLHEPLGWRTPSLVFVDSMSDLFHEDLPFSHIARVFAVMASANQHTYQVLTKRADRMAEFARTGGNAVAREFETLDGGHFDWPLPNVWLGASIENDEYAALRRPALRAIANYGWTTFVSYEPALGPVDWRGFSVLDLIIIGGESGPNARPFEAEWARSTIEHFRPLKTSIFMKQFGRFPIWGGDQVALLDPKGGDMAEWPAWAMIRQLPGR